MHKSYISVFETKYMRFTSVEYLDGKESMEMIRKLFALYRVILFNLLGISRSLYDSYLKSYVSLIDNELTMNEFLSKLSDPSITA